MIPLTPQERKSTALVHFVISLFGVAGSVYLFLAAHTLALRNSSSAVDVLLFACGGFILGALALLIWFGIFCMIYCYGNIMRAANGQFEIVTDNKILCLPKEKIRFIFKTGKIYVAGRKEGIAFHLAFGGGRFIFFHRKM